LAARRDLYGPLLTTTADLNLPFTYPPIAAIALRKARTPSGPKWSHN
jgi:hypothetical protein